MIFSTNFTLTRLTWVRNGDLFRAVVVVGLIFFTGVPILSNGCAAEAEKDSDGAPPAHQGLGNSNDKATMPEKKLLKCEAHEKEAAEHAEVAKINFFSGTNFSVYQGGLGEYHVRAFVRDGENSAMEHRWPMAFVGGQSQTVNAAMWLKCETADAFVLVAVWTFSATGDKNNNYYLEEYSKDVFSFCSRWMSGTQWNCADWENHFSVSQDYWTDHFYCVPLNIISLGEMSELMKLNPNPTPAGPK